MNTTTNRDSRGGGGEDIDLSAGQKLTRLWFPDESSIDRRVDAILQEAEKRCVRDHGNQVHVHETGLFGEEFAPQRNAATAGPAQALNQVVSQAFLAMIRPMPEDHVVVDPDANFEFVSRCRLLGANVSEFHLNKALLNVRKEGKLHRGLDRGPGLTMGRDLTDQIGYAAEMAARLVQLRAAARGTLLPTVDRILCDPSLREEFDAAVKSISPGHSVYEYRLAAFAYRKSGRESTFNLGRTSVPDWDVDDASFGLLDLDDLPADPGVYRITAGSRVLFVSSTLNIRARLSAHLAAGDRQALLPPTLWDPPRGALAVRWFRAPIAWKPRRADAVAQRMKVEGKAMYNLYSCPA